MSVTDKKRFWLPAAAGTAVLTGLVIWFFLHHLEGSYQEAGETVPVLVAKRYIPRGSPIDPAFFQITRIPKAYVEPGAVSQFDVLVSSPGHPRFRSLLSIPEGSQLTQRDLAPIARGEALSQVIPENHVAVSFGLDAVRGLGGNIQPGDLIDVLHTPKGKEMDMKRLPTSALYQAVPVIAVGKKWNSPSQRDAHGDKETDMKPDKDDPEITVLTVLLNPLAAVKLAEARENEILSVTLRAPGDSRNWETPP